MESITTYRLAEAIGDIHKERGHGVEADIYYTCEDPHAPVKGDKLYCTLKRGEVKKTFSFTFTHQWSKVETLASLFDEAFAFTMQK